MSILPEFACFVDNLCCFNMQINDSYAAMPAWGTGTITLVLDVVPCNLLKTSSLNISLCPFRDKGKRLMSCESGFCVARGRIDRREEVCCNGLRINAMMESLCPERNKDWSITGWESGECAEEGGGRRKTKHCETKSFLYLCLYVQDDTETGQAV